MSVSEVLVVGNLSRGTRIASFGVVFASRQTDECRQEADCSNSSSKVPIRVLV